MLPVISKIAPVRDVRDARRSNRTRCSGDAMATIMRRRCAGAACADALKTAFSASRRARAEQADSEGAARNAEPAMSLSEINRRAAAVRAIPAVAR